MQEKQFKKRAAILACLRATSLHPSAEMLHSMLQAEYPDISLATVYRNLTLFKQQGLVRSLGTVDGAERFDGVLRPHVHFVCTACGSIVDLNELELPGFLRQDAQACCGGQIEDVQLSFTGRCRSCQNA